MKQVIYKNHTDDAFYMTSKQNYDSYIQNARAIKRLDGVKTSNDVFEFIEKACAWWNMKETDFIVIL